MRGFWRLLSLTKNYKGLLVLAILCNILMAIFTIVSIPLIIPFFQVLFDRIPEATDTMVNIGFVEQIKQQFLLLIYSEGKEYALVIVCSCITGVFFLKNFFRYFAKVFMVPVRNGMVRDLRNMLYNKYMSLPLSFHIDARKGDLLSRITSDVQEVDYSILNVIEALFKSPLLIIGSISFMMYINPRLTLFTFILLLFTAVVIGSISKVLKKQSSEVQKRLSNLNTHVEESLSAVKIAKAFNAEKFLSQKFDKENEAHYGLINKLLFRRELSSPLSEFLGVTVVAVLLWYGSTLVFANLLEAETFFAFVFAFYNVIEPAKSFSTAYYNIQKGMAASDRIHEVLDLKGENTICQGNQTKKTFTESIIFEDVTFQYQGENIPVLKNINLEIKRGETVALVGQSGGGKTTMIDLLARFFETTKGKILIDGIDVKDIKIDDLRSLFGIVSQDTILFNDSVLNNIGFNNHDIDKEKIVIASKIAHAHEFIVALKDGYNTNIGDQGVKLSGGQKQRIAMARAILHNPPIFILDEATSALDSESERSLQMALKALLQSKTAIVIAHRLSTIQNAQKIVVIDKGEIVEMGNHEELVGNHGTYRKLVEMQSI